MIRKTSERCLGVAAALAAALLLNALTLAPACHEHGGTHDAARCLMCTFHATGTWVVSAAPAAPGPAAAPWPARPVPCERPAQWIDPAGLARGPPTPALPEV